MFFRPRKKKVLQRTKVLWETQNGSSMARLQEKPLKLFWILVQNKWARVQGDLNLYLSIEHHLWIYHCTTHNFSSKHLQTQPDKVRHGHWLMSLKALHCFWSWSIDRTGWRVTEEEGGVSARVSVSLGVELNIWVWMWALIDFIRMESYLHSH